MGSPAKEMSAADGDKPRRVADVGFMPQTNEESLKAAQMLKAEGNEHFKAGNLKDAATCYKHMNLYLRHLDNSKGDKMGGMGKMMNGAGQAQDASQNLTTEETAEAANLMTAMHSNLTTVAMKSKNYKLAVKEATQVLERDDGNIKARFNRAKAYCMLGHTDPCREDIIKCDQSDSGVKAVVQRLEALEKKALAKQRKAMAGMFDKANAKEQVEEAAAQDPQEAAPAEE